MIRSLVLTLIAGFVVAFPVMAQAPVHLYNDEPLDAKLGFINNLRKKGFVNLAKEFTDQLIKTADKKDLPILNLENARTAVALAKEQRRDQRMQMLDEARSAFEPFIKANPDSRAGAEARLEMARLYTMQGQMRLNTALASEEDDVKDKGMNEARALYDAADTEFAAAIKILQKTGPQTAAIEAEFERALGLLDKAPTFKQIRQFALTVDAARKIFAEIAKDRETVNGLLANAYLVKCYQEGQDPPKIAEHMQIVMDAKGPNAIPAQRMAYYYDILYVKTAPSVKGDRAQLLISRAEDWLKTYPTARKTYQGEHLRFEQATTYLQKAAGMTDFFKKEKYDKIKTNPKDKAIFDGNLATASKLAKELELEGGDFSERGMQMHNFIQLKIIELAEPGKSLASFDAALLSAKVKFQAATKAKEPESTKLFREGQGLLSQALALGEEEKVATSKMHEALFLLGSAYYGMNDRRRSAISFETLARANPPSKKGAEAASFAIDLYKQFAQAERDETARYYLHELAAFVLSPARIKLWDGDPVIGFTRYNLALDYLAEEKYPESLEQLAQLPKDFQAYTYAQGQAVFIAMKARERAETPEEKLSWTEKAKAALTRMGALPATADPTSTLMWFTASVEGPKFLYAEAAELLRAEKVKEAGDRYNAMAKNISNLEAVFAKSGGKLADDKKDSVDFTLQVLEKYARLGRADVQYRLGNYDKVLEDNLLGAVVKEVVGKAPKDADAKIPVKDVRVVGESLSLVLRAFIQLGKIDEAKGVYNFLMRIAAEGGEEQDNANFTRALIDDLKNQVEDIKKKNDVAKLKEMVGKFTSFGDTLAKTLVYDNKNRDLRDVKNLVRFYTELDQFKKAADLIKTVPEPKFLAQKNLKANEDQERELYIYWDFQIENGRLLRLSKDYEGANKILARVMLHENARYQTVAEMERNFIYEDRESYGAAIKVWKEFMERLQRSDLKNQKVKELYFDGFFYNVRCFYKLSQSAKMLKEGKEELYLNHAASQIVRLENSPNREGWLIVGPKFMDYMNQEKKLKSAYEKIKRATK